MRSVGARDAAGGVRTSVGALDPASVASFEPQSPDADANGIVPRPNVSLERELVDLKVAEHSFGANLRVLQTQDAMMSSLLDILA